MIKNVEKQENDFYEILKMIHNQSKNHRLQKDLDKVELKQSLQMYSQELSSIHSRYNRLYDRFLESHCHDRMDEKDQIEMERLLKI